jgi:hypothetical protein
MCCTGGLRPPPSLPIATHSAVRERGYKEIDRTSEAIPSCLVALSLGTLRSP